MRFGGQNRALFAAIIALLICASGNTGTDFGTHTVAARGNLPPVRIAEVHYDNDGTDTGEAIEISAPAGTNLANWKLLLYNGSSTALNVYDTKTLTGIVPATCGTRGVVVQAYPSNGIQNGEPDGIALVDPAGAVVEFLSYEGTFTAASGPAIGMTSIDIGVRQNGSALGLSLQRNSDGTWSGPLAHTFGACNDEDPAPPADVATVVVTPSTATIFQNATRTFTAAAFDSEGRAITGVPFTWMSSDPSIATVSTAGVATGVSPGDVTITAATANDVRGSAALHVDALPPPTGPPDTRFSEIHYDNAGADVNEGVEIEGPAGTDLTGWSVVLYNGNGGTAYGTRTLSGPISASCDGRGVAVLLYPADGIQNGSPDGLALVDADGRVVEFVSYEGTFTATDGPAAGLTSIDILAAQTSLSPIGQSLQRYSDSGNGWSLAPSTFGVCNGVPPPPGGNTIAITGRTGADPALPVGFQDQVFATLRSPAGAALATTFTWSSESPAVVSIDQAGVFTALAEGTAVLRATAADGTTSTLALPTRVAVASTTALYAGNAAFGEPADNDPSDDFVVRYPQFTASYNPTRGTPNWVAYELDPTHYGDEDRCDCFTFDPDLPGSFTRYTTADYTGAGAFHGYGIDRGHLARSFDRTSASLDNARTFYFTNIVPQAADLNQGPWASFENFLGNLARTGGKEVYIVTGVAGDKGTVKNEGKIVIPARTWKVAVIMPHDHGLAHVVDYRDLEVIAVNMPNDPGVRGANWETYKTTVDAIEALTGYDLLALLADKVENIVESGTMPPFAVSDGPYTALEGSAVPMSAAASFDPNGTVVRYDWSFGDGTSASGQNVSHTYLQDGTYTVTLVVTDSDELTDTITTTATVSNVPPVLAALVGASNLLPGEEYAAPGSFSDPGADAWAATVDYGDGGGATTLTLAGMTFALSHTYTSPGTFTVTVSLTDGAATATTTTTVSVISASDAIRHAIAAVDALGADGTISASLARSLNGKLTGAIKNIADGDTAGAIEKLQSSIDQLDGLVRGGRLSQPSAAPLTTLLARTIQSLAQA